MKVLLTDMEVLLIDGYTIKIVDFVIATIKTA